jgi:hypothetical protein
VNVDEWIKQGQKMYGRMAAQPMPPITAETEKSRTVFTVSDH